MLRTAIYPGSFDPFTNGHLDIAQRAARLFDQLVVAVYDRPAKDLLFSADERVDMARGAVAAIPNVRVESFSGLTVEYAKAKGACALVRGLRAISDFEYEMEIAHMNRNLNPELEAVFFMSSLPYTYLRSSIVKEIAQLGGSLDALVPEQVEAALRRKYVGRLPAGPPASSPVP